MSRTFGDGNFDHVHKRFVQCSQAFFVALILPLLSAFALLVVFILRSRFRQNKDDSAGDEQRARIAPHR